MSVQKILLTDLEHWDTERIVGAYATRWPIELFFKEMTSALGRANYRVRAFAEVAGWVQACAVAFGYLAWERFRRQRDWPRPEWWFRQRPRGLAVPVRQDIEPADLEQLAERRETAEGRRWLRARLRQAVPQDQRRPDRQRRRRRPCSTKV